MSKWTNVESNFYIERLIVPDSGHDRAHELEKDHETLVRLDTLALGFGLVNEPLEHIWVFTGVDSQHAAVQIGHSFLGDSFIMVLLVDILEYLFRCERQAIYAVALDP